MSALILSKYLENPLGYAGSLSIKCNGVPMRGLSNMRPFSELDTDGDGKLSQQEFAAAQAAHHP